MSKLYIDYDCSIRGSYYSDEEYGEWWEHYEFSIGSVKLVNDDFEEETWGTIDNVSIGDTVYVLVIRYGQGNSFGHASGNGEILWVFTSKEKAEKARTAFETEIEKSKPYLIEIELEDGSLIKIGNPVTDWFDCLEEIEIIEKIVEG